MEPKADPRVALQQTLNDMQQTSDEIDASCGSAEYQARLVALALIARHFLREHAEAVRAFLSTPLAQTWEPIAGLEAADVQLIAWAVVNCHVLARRALARSTSVYDREKWEHVLRICEKAGARSAGVLRASVPTEITDGSEPLPAPPDTGLVAEGPDHASPEKLK